MEPDRSRLLGRERLWETRAGVAALAGALAGLAGFVLLQASLGGDTNYEGLLEAHDKSTMIWLSGVATAIGYALLVGPLLFLFRAAQGRSPQVKNQFLGLVFLGPLLLGAAGLVIAAGTQQAANTYVDGRAESTLTPKEAREDCAEEPAAERAACRTRKREEDRASNAIQDSALVSTGQFIGLAGGLALVVALLYTGLWSLRTGLLTRFWGSFGMAVGFAALLGLSPLLLLWFAYLGLLLLGRVPGGKPPAWEAGEAIPWPTPGERAAAELEGAGEVSGTGDAGAAPEDPAGAEGGDAPGTGQGGERRKRKRRG